MSKAPAVDYAATILEALSCNDGLGITEISNLTGINKNAVSRILGALCGQGWIARRGDGYSLTLKPFRICSRALSRTSLYKESGVFLARLWEKTGDSCFIGVKHGKNVLYIQHLDSTHDIVVAGRVGGEYPLHCSAPGKVLLAYSDEEEQRQYCESELKPRTSNTITDSKVFGEQISLIRENGYAEDNEEGSYGIICLAAPIFDYKGSVIASTGISTATVYSDIKTFAEEKSEAVKTTAAQISAALGYTD
ncbi:MAG: IclR family transcriptional regulator [Clostridiales bacterium]|nr:IclR family transcriptional regulator [Clostridiales bacterium]